MDKMNFWVFPRKWLIVVVMVFVIGIIGMLYQRFFSSDAVRRASMKDNDNTYDDTPSFI